MKKKEIVTLRYKIMKLSSKNGETEEPDWEAMKINPNSINIKYNTEVSWIRKTFKKDEVISIEENDENTSVLNHEEGTFIVQKNFKKLFKLIYNK